MRKRIIELRWLISHDGVKLSTTKCLQVLGGVVASAVLVSMAYKGTLTAEFFAIYLAYTAAIDAYTKFMMAKIGASQPQQDSPKTPDSEVK
jgi:hypothetical protein